MFGFSSDPIQKVAHEELDKVFSGNSIGAFSFPNLTSFLPPSRLLVPRIAPLSAVLVLLFLCPVPVPTSTSQ